jgi:hypothetical protein
VTTVVTTVKRNRFMILASGLAMVLAMAFVAVAVNLAQAKPPQQELPTFDPANFDENSTVVDNTFFPLVPGTTYYYEGVSDGVPTSNVVTITRETKTILGVEAIVVHDLAYEDGELVEETFDWFAQDKDGNVWYLGEDSFAFDCEPPECEDPTAGSWEAGVNGAEAGIIMLANPQVRDSYHQEFAPGVAEDQAQVLSLDESVSVPYGDFENVLQTKEWTVLERGVVEHKYYAEGVGFIFGEMVKGGEESTELVKITGPGRN